MATFSENNEWVNVNRYFNYDYVVADETTANIEGDTPFVGDYLYGDNGAGGYIYDVSGDTIKIGCNTSTLFANGSATFSRSGLILSTTLSNVSATYGSISKPLAALTDRDYYLKNRVEELDVEKLNVATRQTVMSGVTDINGYADIIKTATTTVYALLHYASGTLDNSSDSGATFATIGSSADYGTTVGAFGESSGALFMTNSTVGIQSSATIGFSNYDDWTVETKFKINDIASASISSFIFGGSEGGVGSAFKMELYHCGDVGFSGNVQKFVFAKADGSVSEWDLFVVSNTATVSEDTWHHVAISYKASESKYKVFFDGNLIITANETDDLNVDQKLIFGNQRSQSGQWGRSLYNMTAINSFDETRIVLGEAVYWDDDGFNVPTQPYQDTTLTPMGGLINWYKFDDLTGTDEISASTATVGVNVTSTTSKFGTNAIECKKDYFPDGSIQLSPNFHELASTSTFSSSMWVYYNDDLDFSGTSGDRLICLSRGYANSMGTLYGDSVQIYKSSKAIFWARYNNVVPVGAFSYLTSEAGKVNDGWNHIVCVHTNGTGDYGYGKLYLNGELQAEGDMYDSVPYPLGDDSGTYNIGQMVNSEALYNLSTTYSSQTIVDQVRKFDTALTDEEVLNLYNEGLAGLSGARLNVDKPIIMTSANGFNTPDGNDDYVFKWNQEKKFDISELQNGTHYVYAEYNSTDSSVTIGTTITVPQYNYKVNGLDSGVIRMDASGGSDGATSYIDIYNSEVTFSGSQALGITNSETYFVSPTTSDCMHVTNPLSVFSKHGNSWEIELTYLSTSISDSHYNFYFQDVASTSSTAADITGIVLAGSNNKIQVWLSSDGVSWDICANPALTETITPTVGEEHTVKLNWDGSYYKLFNNGTHVLTVTSSEQVFADYKDLRIGSDDTASAGQLDQNYLKWVVTRPYVTATQTHVSSTVCPNETFDYFSIPEMKMTDAYSGTQNNRVYLGEIEVADGSVTDVISYAYNGEYHSEIYDVAVNNTYIKNHNIGTEHVNVEVFARQDTTHKWCHSVRFTMENHYTGPSWVIDSRNDLWVDYNGEDIDFGTPDYVDYIGGPKGNGPYSFTSLSTTGQNKVSVKRSF